MAYYNFIDEYDDELFWKQLVTRLAERDYVQQYGDEEEVDFETKIHRLTKIEKRYADEINSFGLSNIVVNDKKPSLH